MSDEQRVKMAAAQRRHWATLSPEQRRKSPETCRRMGVGILRWINRQPKAVLREKAQRGYQTRKKHGLLLKRDDRGKYTSEGAKPTLGGAK